MKTDRSAFTLVEMLVVIIIIGILASITLGGIQYAQHSARETRTKATITKINRFVMEKYASYQDRRAPVDTYGKSPKEAAAIRLAAIRELQIIEMPDHWSDIKDTPGKFKYIASGNNASWSRFNLVGAGRENTDNVPAELLYLMVMGLPGAPESFMGGEVGDTDNNGLKEFVDGWGRPIMFIRWPAGFLPPDMITSLQTGNPTTDHDPFDIMGVDENAFAIYPLIYSAGGDGQFGILPSQTPTQSGIAGVQMFLPYKSNSGASGTGNEGGTGNTAGDSPYFYDNINNHALD
ncbi:MAG: type II secretion system protein [Planctomycetia bacterium]|nr:type II secretion system protein [Planctomycetia bacterium]